MTSKKTSALLKLLWALVFLMLIIGGLGAFFLRSEHKKAQELNDNISATFNTLEDLKKISRERLTANRKELVQISKEINEGTDTIDNKLEIIKNLAPVHLTRHIPQLSQTGLFYGKYLTLLEEIKTNWETVKKRVLMSRVSPGSRTNISVVNKVDKDIQEIQDGVSNSSQKVSATGSYMKKLLKLMLATLIGLAFLLLIFSLMLFNKNKRTKGLEKKASLTQGKPKKGQTTTDDENVIIVKRKETDPLEQKNKNSLVNTKESSHLTASAKKSTTLPPNKQANKHQQEIDRLKTLCETLFNDKYRALCIADQDGDILMENEVFKQLTQADSAEFTLPEMLEEQLNEKQYSRFISGFENFFKLSPSKIASLKPLEGVKFGTSNLQHRVSLQPFHAQGGELCSLVSIQEMTPKTEEEISKSAAQHSEQETPSESNTSAPSPPPEEEEEEIFNTRVQTEEAASKKIIQKEYGTEETTAQSRPSTPLKKSNLTDKNVIISDQDVITPKKPRSSSNKKQPPSVSSNPKPILLTNPENEEDPFGDDPTKFAILPVIKDLSNKLASVNGKKIRLNTKNFDESLIPENLKPIILETLGQAVKFSIPRSIETSEERTANKKPAVASILLSNKPEKNIKGLGKDGIIFYYKDDGRGIDPELIYDVANEAKLTSKKSAEELSKNEVLSFLFNSKFILPKEHALDIVNLVRLKDTVVKSLKGKMRLSYQEGESFSFQLLVPTEKDTF